MRLGEARRECNAKHETRRDGWMDALGRQA